MTTIHTVGQPLENESCAWSLGNQYKKKKSGSLKPPPLPVCTLTLMKTD